MSCRYKSHQIRVGAGKDITSAFPAESDTFVARGFCLVAFYAPESKSISFGLFKIENRSTNLQVLHPDLVFG